MPQVNKPRFWRSVEDFTGDREIASHGYPELVGREFPVGATEIDGATRRDFLKMVGLTAAGTMAAGCMRNPPEKILPYVRQPADLRPGLPLHYATSMSLDGFGVGLLVTSREGRPIKVEGNPEHPSSFGTTGTFEQALAYGVYDPQRGKALKVYSPKDADKNKPKQNWKQKDPSGWKTFVAEVQSRMPLWKQDSGSKVRFLDAPTASPFDAWLRKQIKAALPKATFSTFASLDRDALYEGTQLAFGQALDARYDFDRARCIVSLDDDFLESGPDRLVHARDFARHRTVEAEERLVVGMAAEGGKTPLVNEPGSHGDPQKHGAEGPGDSMLEREEDVELERHKRVAGMDTLFGIAPVEQMLTKRVKEVGTNDTGWMNRLYVAECGFSVTGAQADHRLRVRSSKIAALAAALYARIVPSAANDVAGLAAPFKDDKWVDAVAKDVMRRGPESVVTAGARQPAEVHAMVAAMNAALKSEVVSYHTPVLLDTKSGSSVLKDLVTAADAGEIDTLVITAWNPVYAAPADVDLVSALAKIPNVIYLGTFEDETFPFARWYLPAAHELESWGDSTSIDGTIAIQQPLIAPLFNGVQRAELFAAFAGMYDRSSHELLKASHAETFAEGANHGGFEAWWERVVQKGVLQPVPPVAVETTVAADKIADKLRSIKFEDAKGIEINFVVDNKVYDGRYGDNAWLQELPDPLTKVTWGNTAMISPTTAEKNNLKAEQFVKLTVGGRSIVATLYVLPGHADEALSIAIGYGRLGGEEIARGVGSNANALRTADLPWFGGVVSLAETEVNGNKSDRLGITQEHWAMEGRPIALVADLAKLKAEAKGKRLKILADNNNENDENPPSMMDEFTEKSGDGYLWAMAIDMSKCTGCNACILACESENNILIVGKEQVRRGREMHWLRIDRYFEGDLEDPQVVTQPMACVQCEKAPCEYVCPVNATVHSDEGLNDMVYNRCVGTRYCANNCPYKVRRFNYLNWHNNLQGTLEMKMNPDVTVRARGVIEKCTYCVQRIEQARIATRIENHGVGRTLRDGEVVTACQQSCASGAITFGSVHDNKSEVWKLHHSERAYQVLWELNTRPRTRHLAKVRNPNPELV